MYRKKVFFKNNFQLDTTVDFNKCLEQKKKLLISLHTCAHLSELPSSIHTMPPGAVVAQYALDNKNGNFGIIHGHLRYWMLAGINSAILAHTNMQTTCFTSPTLWRHKMLRKKNVKFMQIF